MNNGVSHDGVVTKIEGSKVTVEFVQSSACSGCHARQMCASGESKQRQIVAGNCGYAFQVGDPVTITVSQELARTAFFYAFGLPAILVLVALFPLIHWLGDYLACGAALLLIAAYYGVFYLLRNRLERKVCFRLEPRRGA